MPKTLLRHIAALSLLTIFLASIPVHEINAQQRDKGVIDTYAVTNARIVTVSGPTIERGTVVMRDGIITAVGVSVTPPADARLIDGTGLTVYPGLIDANTSLGMPAPAPSPSPSPARGGRSAGAPDQGAVVSSRNSLQPVGLQPEILTIDFLRAGGDVYDAAKNAGITSALVVPRDGIFIGQSAFVNLAGDTPQDMLVQSPVALHVGFTPLRNGGYPASLMGVFSALRQMFLDAGRLREANEIYERNPRGVRRPVQDKSLLALLPALARQMPVVLYADSEREIRRALDLAHEFSLKAIIAGGLESWKVTDRLRESNVPVLLSLNFPKRATADVPDADPESLRVLRQRVEAPRNAGRLASAGVRFAFQSGAMTNIADFLPNASKAIQNGLSRDEALRAMTVRPADILGVIDRMGTIEVGKIANLTVTRGDIFDKSTRIAYVFIDGRPIELKPATQDSTPTSKGATGTWTISIRMEGAPEEKATLSLKQEGTALTGSIQGDFASVPISNGSIDSSGNVKFTASVTFGEKSSDASFVGKISGNQITGTVQTVGMATATFAGTRPD